MHIEYLYYFEDFAETLSISKTAANFFMTPQGLSRALHQLEKDFGITLIAYQNNSVTLTPAGEELGRHVRAVTRCYEEAKGSLTKYRLAEVGSVQDRVRITMTPCVSQYLAILLNLQKPGLFPFNIKMNEANLYRIVPHIITRDNEEAFGIISLPSTTKYRDVLDEMVETNGMVYEPLFVSPLVALVSTFSPLAKLDVVRPSDIDPYPVARYKDSVLGDALDDFIREDNVKTVTNSRDVIVIQILEYQAVSFGPKLIDGLRTMPDQIISRPTEGFFNTEFGLIMSKENAASERVGKVTTYIKDKVKKESEQARYAGTFDLL